MSEQTVFLPQTPDRVRCDAEVPDVLRGEIGQVASGPWMGKRGEVYVDVVFFGGIRKNPRPEDLEVWRQPWKRCP